MTVFKKGCSIYLNKEDIDLLLKADSHFFDWESVDDGELLESEEKFRNKFDNLVQKIKTTAAHANRAGKFRRY